MSNAATQMIPRDTRYYQTLPEVDLIRLWDQRLERFAKFVNMNAPQEIIDREHQLVSEAREAVRARLIGQP